MFTVYLVNFGYSLNDGQGYRTFQEAVVAAKKAGFEALILRDKVQVATWAPIGGLRHWRP